MSRISPMSSTTCARRPGMPGVGHIAGLSNRRSGASSTVLTFIRRAPVLARNQIHKKKRVIATEYQKPELIVLDPVIKTCEISRGRTSL
jgi:hypothetical protein